MANLEGQELAARYDWSALVFQTSFTTTAAEDQDDSVPVDFGHYVIDSMWNRTTVRKIYGPLTSADWQQEKSFPVYTAVNPGFRLVQPTGNYPRDTTPGFTLGRIMLTPTPPAGQSVYYEYVSQNWCLQSSSGINFDYYNEDTSTALISEQAVLQGTLWRFKQAKGFDYSQEFAIYEALVARLQAQDGGGKPRLNLNTGLSRRSAWPVNVPSGSWGQ